MSTTEPQAASSAANIDDVVFTAFGSDSKRMPWRPKLTVQDVLNYFGANKKWRQKIVMNSKKARGGDTVPKGASIILASAVSNG